MMKMIKGKAKRFDTDEQSLLGRRDPILTINNEEQDCS